MTINLDLKQQLSLLEDIDYYKIKIRMGTYWRYIPASKLLSNSLNSDELLYIEDSQTKLVDIRDIDDDEQVSQLNINAEYFENDTELNQIYRSLVMLPVPKTGLIDRSGIFLSNSEVTIPENTQTTKTYATIMDETAQSYADLNPIILWSGGVDSTAIIAAFVKNNINFSVTLDTNTQAEAPVMYDYVQANFNCLHFNTYTFNQAEPFSFLKEKIINRVLVTGDCNDQIFPILQHHLAIGKKFFKLHVENVDTEAINSFYKLPVEDNIKYMPSRDYFVLNHSRIHGCAVAESGALYDSVIAPKLSQFPIATEYAYQLVSYFRFIFKYQMHLDKQDNWNTTNNLNNTFKAFYNTDDFQRWSITNFENNYETQSTTYLTMKSTVKQYSYDVFGINEILEQHKRASSPARMSMPG
jgi:hypothetical protein